jgi:hypothetical protein
MPPIKIMALGVRILLLSKLEPAKLEKIEVKTTNEKIDSD